MIMMMNGFYLIFLDRRKNDRKYYIESARLKRQQKRI